MVWFNIKVGGLGWFIAISISPEESTLARLEFELANLDVSLLNISHYTMKTPLNSIDKNREEKQASSALN